MAVQCNFSSRFETEISMALTKAMIEHDYERLAFNYHLPNSSMQHVYTPDFSFPHSPIVLEVKGWPFNKKERNKYRAVKRCNPNLDLRIVFQNPSLKIYGKTGMTFGQWASKFGFKWSDKVIPQSWIDEIRESQSSFMNIDSTVLQNYG